jgi:hypothetical protein
MSLIVKNKKILSIVMCHNLKNKIKMGKIKKIINPILLSIMMFLCLAIVAQAEEMPALEVDKNVVVVEDQNPVIPTLENSIEQKNADEIVAEKNVGKVNIPQPQDDYASLVKIVLISAFIMALLVLLAGKLYNKIRKKRN